MAYRYQVVSVGMWRGKIKRWNTTVHLSNTSSTSNVRSVFQKSGYVNPGDVAGACSGGVASIAIYNSTGGQPISNTIYFDWETPSTWIPYTGEAWAAVPVGTPLDASGESALVIEGNMAALSITGKPVKTRKFLHAIPSRTAAAFTDPDVLPATLTAFQGIWTASYMANPAGVQPTSVTVQEWYGNHQRVRGKRKPVAALAQTAYAAGVTAGAVASTGGGSQPFRAE